MTAATSDMYYSYSTPTLSLSNSQKAFVITLVLYTAVVGAFYVSFQHFAHSTEQKSNLKQVAISASMFSVAPPTPKVQPVTKPVQKVQPPTPVKPVHEPEKQVVKKVTPKPVHKPVEKVIPKPAPVKKAVKPTPVKPIEPAKVEPQKTVTKPVTKPIEQPVQKAPAPPVSQAQTITKQQSSGVSPAQQAKAEKVYLAELQEALSRYAQNTYPFMAKRRHWEGNVQISFTLHHNGDITDVRVSKPDIRDMFNDAAMSIFTDEMQMHYKPFPKEISRNSWEISVPISYFLR